MLTLPSEPLPQTVLMEPLPSIPPSFVSYGLTGSRRSPRKHHVTERRAAAKPYDKTSAQARPRQTTDMVTVSHSVPSRLEKTPPKEPPSQERLDISVSTENITDNLTRPQISLQRPRPSPHACPAPLQTGPLLNYPDTASKGWVIGPLFQSFKSKMASFTEIVMSPFKSNGGGELEPSSAENTTGGYVTAEEEAANQDELKMSPPKSVHKFEEATNLTHKTPDDSDSKLKNDDVPLRIQETQLESSVTQSAWNTTSTTTTTSFNKVIEITEEECVSRSARARKRPNKAATKATDVGGECELAQNAVNDTDCKALMNTDSEIKYAGDFISKDDAGESQADQTPTSPSILEDASLKKVKRTLNLSGNTGKRKKMAAKMEEQGGGGKGECSAQKRKPKRNGGFLNAEEMIKTVTKATTRSKNKKTKVERGEVAMTIDDESIAGGNLMDFGTREDTTGPKAKAKTAKRSKTKSDQSLDLQASLAVTPPDALTATKQTGNVAAAGKKRKAKDASNARSGVTACALSSAEVGRVACAGDKTEKCEKTGRKLKKCKVAAEKSEKGAVAAEVEAKVSRGATEKVYFEMTPCESDARPVSWADDAASDRGVAKRRARRMEPQRRRCRAIHGSKSPSKRTAEDAVAAMTRDDSEVFRKGLSTRLQRSVSCPEIPTLRLHETPWTPHFHSPPRSRSQPPQQQQHPAPHSLSSSSSSSLAHHFHRSARRARRHTVCSLEVEREIAPLCLRKEVYPARRSPSPYDPQHLSPMRALSPGASLSALASCFLSSPLAFLSKKSEGGARGTVSSPIRTLSPKPAVLRSLSPSASTLRSLSPAGPAPSAPSLSALLGTSLGQLPGFHLRTDTLHNASSDSSNGVGVTLLVCDPDRPPAPEEDEDTSSSSPESEELREEAAHSDSELKVLKKDQGQRKVSSIKIRKALPKPQNNLTPMGLPKAVRVKKKEFSLEEIYTNKNFSKPPESRLETIFEVPLSRKNGSESWCGPRRVKRFLEFPELGEARRPRKPPTGAAKANAAAKANTAANSRPRRGGCREDPALGSDPDSVLCAKLEQLEVWLRQNDS